MVHVPYMINDYPDAPEQELICCPACGEEMSEETYEVDGAFVCEGCFKDYIEELGLEELAERMGVRHTSRYA